MHGWDRNVATGDDYYLKQGLVCSLVITVSLGCTWTVPAQVDATRKLPGRAYFATLLSEMHPNPGSQFGGAPAYVFDYQSYEDYATSGQQLKADLLAEGGLDGFILLGHSMGGLVAREAARILESTSQSQIIRGIITLATPHLGTPLVDAAVAKLWKGVTTNGGKSLSSKHSFTRDERAPLVMYGGDISGDPRNLLRSYPYTLPYGQLCLTSAGCNNDGAVPVASSLPGFIGKGTTTNRAVFSGYDHSQMNYEDGPTHDPLGLYANIAADLSLLLRRAGAVDLNFDSQPASAATGSRLLPVTVAVRDGTGLPILTPIYQVSIALGHNPSGATLTGTTTVATVSGKATFSDLVVDRPGTGYTLVASAVGLSMASNTFVVSGPGTPTVTLGANPSSINAGQSSSLSWSSTNATSCSATWTASTAASGSATVSPTVTTVYAMGCTGPGGVATASATVTVGSPPPPPGGLASGGTRSGTISVAGAIDTYTFAASQGDAIVLSLGKGMGTATLEPWIRLVSPTGALIGEHFAVSAAQVTLTAPATGIYTVLVGSDRGPAYANYGRFAGTGSYLLSFVSAPGTLSISPGDEGGAMTNGASHTGNIGTGDVDPWSFTATQGDAIVLSLGKGAATATLEPWVRLVSPTGAIIGEHFAVSAAQITLTAPASGAYTVLVGSDRGPVYINYDRYAGTGSYLLTLVKAPGTLSISPGDEGGAMTNGASHTGNIGTGDVDPWSFTATQGDAIVLSLGKGAPGATLEPWIRLVSPTGVIIGEQFGVSAAQITLTAPASGAYTVIVGSDKGPAYINYDRYAGTGSYVLILTK